MTNFLRVLIACAALGLNSAAYANFSMSPSGTTTAFAIDSSNQGTSLCAAASTECPASVPINTAGAPLFTSGTPGLVTLTGTNNINNIAGTVSLPTGAATAALQATNTATTAHTCSVAGFSELGCLGQLDDDVKGPIAAGTNIVGKVGIDQTTPGTTNGVQVNAALPAGTNNIGLVTPALATSGGYTTSFFQPAASDNHTNLKNGAGQVYWVLAENNSATVNYLRFYNAATGFNGCNSATNLVTQIQIPANTAVGGVNLALPFGIPFSTGISYCVTSGYATNDTTNATATAISITIGYN